MATPHIKAEKGAIASTVLMPGDPLRAKYIADNFLTDVVQFNAVRNMFGYTGLYNGKRISVMGSGMGMPSIGIYSYELFTEFGVNTIIRVGSVGGIADKVKVHDIVLAMGVNTDSNWMAQYGVTGTFAPTADYGLLSSAVREAEKQGHRYHVGNVLSSDLFYNADKTQTDKWKALGTLGVEMETAALYANAAYLGKRALTVLTVSDHLYTGESLSSDVREQGFTDMMKLALEVAYNND